ncbi:MAG: tol-pal system protein YbgF [Neptuniibacter sp.]
MVSSAKNTVAALALILSANAVAEDVPVIELGVDSNATVPSRIQYNNASSSSSELLMLVQQLQDEVRTLRGQLEQQGYQLKQMEGQQLDRYRDLDRRLNTLSSSPVVDKIKVETQATPPVATSGKPNTASALPAAGLNDSKAYRDAFGLVLQRDYQKATAAFKSFIIAYPQSARLPNAYYWLGEIYLAEQKPEQAREPFVNVITKFPKHSKAPDAAYKLGVVYDQLGDKQKSREYLDMVLNQYPDSAAVKLATEFKRAQ